MNLQQAKGLLALIATDSCTEAQKDAFMGWLEHAEKDDYQAILIEWEKLLEEQPMSCLKFPDLILRIETSINEVATPVVPLYEKEESKGMFMNWRIIAASVVLMVASAVFFYNSYKDNLKPSVAHLDKHEIKPGGNKAILILADGSKVDLNEIGNGEVANQAGIKVEKSIEDQLIYTVIKSNQTENSSLFNTIKTPIGGQYRVTLPDGSRIWLNAASSLRYPMAFSADERRVELDGEAYFEISKDKTRPFLVVSNRQTVKVLGTHFNVNSYDDEDNTKTTLLEGSVEVFALVNKKSVVLSPGQQSQVNARTVSLKDVDATDAAAWKDGFFAFNDESIPSAMRKIARWYDLEISYEGAINEDNLTGQVSRFANVSEVLKTLELTNLVHFKVEGRKIKVIAN